VVIVVWLAYADDVPRSPRILEPNGIYHLTPRGNDGRRIFTANDDRLSFLTRLDRAAREHDWIVLGYCLMDNHIHLLIQAPGGDLSAGMQQLLSGYSHWWNRRHGHFGHVFVNRFHHTAVLADSHLLETARYIDLNPVRAGICSRPESWAWSSYRAHAGLEHPLPFLQNTRFLRLFGPTPDMAIEAYRRFVREGRSLVSGSVTEASQG
jgi:putative transposase